MIVRGLNRDGYLGEPARHSFYPKSPMKVLALQHSSIKSLCTLFILSCSPPTTQLSGLGVPAKRLSGHCESTRPTQAPPKVRAFAQRLAQQLARTVQRVPVSRHEGRRTLHSDATISPTKASSRTANPPIHMQSHGKGDESPSCCPLGLRL